MQHLPILPILIPLLMGTLMLLPPLGNTIVRQRVVSVASNLVLMAVSLALLIQSLDQSQIYAVGDWQPPFGIIIVADQLSALLVLLTSVLSFGALLFSLAGEDNQGKYFHSLFMYQLMGINGAFLTGDIFNLFVFFEVLLIASYALLIHGGGKAKTAASVHYVTLNLIGSAFFLFALGILYGTLGTLNMGDMAAKVGSLGPGARILAEAGVLLLLLVFGLKTAMLPMHFWLPRTYAAASAPVAALFAIMTKVGVYAIFRIHTVVFGANAGELAFVAVPWIWPLAIGTIIVASIGVLAAPTLRIMIANLALISAGTLLLAVVLLNPQAVIAGLYYLVHTTLVTGALFLLADLIATQRGQASDRFVVSRPMAQAPLLGVLFFIGALTVVGLPPFSGFVGKALLLQAAETNLQMGWIWPTILISSLMVLIGLSRAGTNLFWHLSGNKPGTVRSEPIQIVAIAFLLSASPLLVIFGGPVTEFAASAAEQMQATYPRVQTAIEGGSP
ncbi:monovalent cation/H+ antiporter subunit D [Saccharospirillum salsuginis]|uniref:Monovalent cation/H+ antiporter subunit D n=1 Tax=Saccharospirillum salsuginis TaxID=418750 RepID=A0A918N6I4_9GAMM|nr:monovalent cation/H+ antiporter subunit D [Saccharospirillum salsuginis]GGX43554.1 monovalent cation/H+ antiporter subunit D [Saccharospirillum salsuginis]